MAVLHRALFTWFVLLVFLILLVLRLENRITWSWFIVFLPLFLYDVILILCITFNMVFQCMTGYCLSLMKLYVSDRTLQQMAVLHRALFTWFVLLVFLILLVLRLENRITWSWFIVFLPLFLYDVILILCIAFNMVSQCKSGLDRFSNSIQRKICYVVAVALKMTTQVLLCLRLDQVYQQLSMFYIFTPIWLLAPFILVDVFRSLIRPNGNRYL